MTRTPHSLLILMLLLVPFLPGCGDGPGLGDVDAIDAGDDPCRFYMCDGEFVDGVTWNDARGLNAFVVSKEVERSGERVARQSLNVARMIMVRPDDARERWSSSHVARDQCGPGFGLIGEIVVTDLDGNGLGEVTYICNVEEPCDSTRPTAEIVMHAGKTVYEAQGSVAPTAGQTGDERQAITYGPELTAAPEMYRSFVDSLWDTRRAKFQAWASRSSASTSQQDDQ